MLLPLLVLTITGAAAFWDARTGRIPNWITAPAFGLALAFQAWGAYGLAQSGQGLDGAAALRHVTWAIIAGMVVCAVLPLLLYCVDAMGGGDVKLLAALGALLGAELGFQLLVYSMVAATIYGLAVMAWRGQLKSALANTASVAKGTFSRKGTKDVETSKLTMLKFGPAVFAAACVLLIQRNVMFA